MTETPTPMPRKSEVDEAKMQAKRRLAQSAGDQGLSDNPQPAQANGSEYQPVKPQDKDAQSNIQQIEQIVDEVKQSSAMMVEQLPDDSRNISIGQRLLEKGLISKDQLGIAMKEHAGATSGKTLGAVLIDMGFVTESTLSEMLAESSGGKAFDIKKTVLDPKLIQLVPKEIAQRHKAIPINIEGDSVQVAITDIYNILAIDQLSRYFDDHLKIVPVYAPESDLLEIIDQYYGYETTIEGILKEIEHNKARQLSGEEEGYVNPTVRLVDAVLVDAIKRGASDIHFEPEGAFVRLRYRIDGQLIQVLSFHKDYWPAVVVRIKIMSGMNIAETRNPQDGRTSYVVLGREVDFRVATHPTVYGENIVMRILDKQKALMDIDELGLSDHNEKMLKRLLKRPEGVIVVTGPTGSGKTTTLYSVLNYINDIGINIMTLENPVEYQLSMLRQSDIKEDKGMDFVSGMKSLMRQDPDVIFVGEVRDEETANMAMRAAMTGHRVFTTLHTNDAPGAILRLVDIGVPQHLLAGSLICVLAQRLVRKLCGACKKQTIATPSQLRLLGLPEQKKIKLYAHNGCDICSGTGYKGRMAVHEIFPVDKGMDDLIATNATRKTMVSYSLKKGYVPMMQDGIAKVLQGITDIDELIRTVDMTERL